MHLVLRAGSHQSQLLGARAALPVHYHHARAGSRGRSWQLCSILIRLSPSLLLLFVFTAAMANDTIPQTGSHACNRCYEPPKPLMEELWQKANRLSKLASGPSPGACAPHSVALAWGKMGPVLIKVFTGFLEGQKLQCSPMHSLVSTSFPSIHRQRHFNPAQEKPTLPFQPGDKQLRVPCAKCPGRRLTRRGE